MPSGALAPPPHFPLPFPLPSLQRSRHHAPFMATMAGPHPSVAPLPLPAFPLPLGLQKLHSSPGRSPFSTSSPHLCSTALQSSAATTKLGLPPSIRRLAASPSTPTTAGVLSGGELRCPPVSPRVCAFPHRRLLAGVPRPGLAAVGSPGLCTASSTLPSSLPTTSLPPRPLLRVVKRGTPVSATPASFTTRRRHAPWRSALPARATSPSTPSASPARAQAPRPTPAPNRGPEHRIRLLRPFAAASTGRRRATPPAEPPASR